MTRSWSCESSRQQRPLVPILSVRATEFEGHDVLDMLIPSAKCSNKTVWVTACLASLQLCSHKGYIRTTEDDVIEASSRTTSTVPTRSGHAWRKLFALRVGRPSRLPRCSPRWERSRCAGQLSACGETVPLKILCDCPRDVTLDHNQNSGEQARSWLRVLRSRTTHLDEQPLCQRTPDCQEADGACRWSTNRVNQIHGTLLVWSLS